MLRRTLTTALALAFAAVPAFGQLDLPRSGNAPPKTARERGREPRGNVAPHLVCTVCGERNYTTAIQYGAEDGRQDAWCAVCRAWRPHLLPLGPQGSPGVDLPATPVRTSAEPAPAPGGEARPRTGVAAMDAPPPAVPGAAAFIFDQVAKASRLDDPLVRQAPDGLLALGAPGLEAARERLGDSNAAVVLTAARVMMRGGDGADGERVVERLRGRLPAKASAPLLSELLALDPVRATPRLLAGLLDHPQSPVRASARRALVPLAGPELVPFLAPLLDSRRSDTRESAIQLLGTIDDPAVLELLLAHVDDPKAHVAWSAVRALAASRDPRIEVELLAAAFRERWVLRPGAYALLAIVEREDRTLEPILGSAHVDKLLGGLQSNDPFIAGSCATALAGIGFRSDELQTTEWLDHDVVETLVAAISGQEFFDDHSSLQEPALRRLKLVTGVSFGTDGPRWAEWWLGVRDGFTASRAAIRIAEGDERGLLVQYRAGGNEPTAFALIGPARSEASAGASGETIFLSDVQALEFVELLRREGVLGPECLPGVRGGQAHRGRSLRVEIAGNAKQFVFGPGASEPWFERVVGMAKALRERCRWQRFPDVASHGGSRAALWRAESAWWGGDHDDHERDLRLKGLVLAHLQSAGPSARDLGVTELEQLYARSDVAEPDDFPVLVDLLESEPFFDGRAQRLATLALAASGAAGESPDGAARARADELVDALHDRFGQDAASAIGEVLSSVGSSAVLAAARDQRPLLRAIAASNLARDESPLVRGALIDELVRDPDPRVEIAAVLAAGEAKVEEARTELLVRARVGEPEVRAAALIAIGKLGGEDVTSALLVGLSDRDPAIKAAAAEGMAELGDSKAAPLFVSLLRQSDPDVREAARRGLLRLGPGAWDELIDALRASAPEARREAALLLARQGVPEAASPLMQVVTDDPDDRAAAWELAVLTCVDPRDEEDPAAAWWHWWDTVRHDDSLAWMRAAFETRGVPTPPATAFEGAGSAEAIAFLLTGLASDRDHLVERCRRELGRCVGRDLGELPPRGAERDSWIATLGEALADTRQ